MTLVESAGLSDVQLAVGRAFLRTLTIHKLREMLDMLLPGVRTGEAGPATWVAVNAIREEIEGRTKDAGGN